MNSAHIIWTDVSVFSRDREGNVESHVIKCYCNHLIKTPSTWASRTHGRNWIRWSSGLRKIHIQILCSARALCLQLQADAACALCLKTRDRCLPLKSDLEVTLFLTHHLQNGDKQHFCLTRVLWEQIKVLEVRYSGNHESPRWRESIQKGLIYLSEQQQFGQIFIVQLSLLNLQCSSYRSSYEI